MNFNEYQKKALLTNLKKEDEFKELMQQVLGLVDEVGEVDRKSTRLNSSH